MGSLSTFQIIVLGIFSILILVGVGVFAAFGGLLGGASVGPVEIWGTMNADQFTRILDTMRTSDKSFEQVKYVEKDPATYDEDLLDAMASGNAPDLFIISQENVLLFSDKVLTIPYGSVSQGSIVNNFIDESRLLLTPQGSLGLPLTIDPLVMYWNRDLFASAALATPPDHWNDFLQITPKLTAVKKNAVPLGEWQNINNAKAIMSALFMQTGDLIVVRQNDGVVASVFGSFPDNATEIPAASALRFYTEFANPSKTTYAWNRSLKNSRAAFVSGDAAVYFGYASEYPELLQANPNLSIGVALLPQLEGNSSKLTFGVMQALSIPRSAFNPNGALTIAQKLTSPQGIALISQSLGLPPVRRDVPVDTSGNAAATVFVQSSLIARAWLDPDPVQTDMLFKSMVESVVSGRNTPPEIVAEVANEMQQLVGI